MGTNTILCFVLIMSAFIMGSSAEGFCDQNELLPDPKLFLKNPISRRKFCKIKQINMSDELTGVIVNNKKRSFSHRSIQFSSKADYILNIPENTTERISPQRLHENLIQDVEESQEGRNTFRFFNLWCLNGDVWNCDSTNECDENHAWRKADSATATEVKFHLRMSLSLVDLLSKDGVLQKVEEFLGSKMSFIPTDIFGLRTNPSFLQKNKDSSAITFSLQPGTHDVKYLIENLRHIQDCDFFCPNNSIQMFGNEIFVVGGHFNVQPVHWSGIKTIVTFDLVIEYDKLKSVGMTQTENAVATFLHNAVELRSRDIYDLTISNSDTKSTVMFSLPPIIEHNLQNLLQSMNVLMSKPCIELCIGGTSGDTADECKNCDAVSLPGANIYPAPRSLQTYTNGWTGCISKTKSEIYGTERRFIKEEIVTAVCTEHQEVCRKNRGIARCVGIGTCDKRFYKNLEVILLVHGQLMLFDIKGMEFALTTIEQTLENLFNFCKGSLTAELFNTGRTTTGIRIIVAPSISRTEGMKGFDELIMTQDTIRVMDLDISKVEGSYAKRYLDAGKPVPRYIEGNTCFNCIEGEEVWCITTKQSLCLPKKTCLAEHLKQLKLADDTDLIRISFLVKGSEKEIIWTDDVKFNMEYQIIDVLGCDPDQVRDFRVDPYDTSIWEVGFDLLNKGNLSELTEQLFSFRWKAETEELVLYTYEDNLRSLESSIWFQQRIFGHDKHVVITKKSGNAFVLASGLFILIVFILALLGMMIIKKRSSFKSKAKGKKTDDETNMPPPQKCYKRKTFLSYY